MRQKEKKKIKTLIILVLLWQRRLLIFGRIQIEFINTILPTLIIIIVSLHTYNTHLLIWNGKAATYASITRFAFVITDVRGLAVVGMNQLTKCERIIVSGLLTTSTVRVYVYVARDPFENFTGSSFTSTPPFIRKEYRNVYVSSFPSSQRFPLVFCRSFSGYCTVLDVRF